MSIFVNPQNLETWEVSSFVGGNPTLEIDKGERPHFPYKRGSFPLGLKKKERETIGLPHPRVGGPNDS